jgi:preprotein translocase subunit YajC
MLQSEGFDIRSMLPFALMFVVVYFFMIRPQLKKHKNEKKFQTELQKGSKIITTSGIHGKIIEFNEKDQTVIIETSAGKLKFERAAISMEMSKKYLQLQEANKTQV